MSGVTPDAAARAPVHGRFFARSHRVLMAGAIALATISFSLATLRFLTFRASSYDLAVFEQAMWKLSHLRDPFVQLIGWNIFADHLSPVLVLFAPLYALAASPLWFFAAQGIAFGCGLPALASLLDVLGVTNRATRAALYACYILSPLLWNAVLFDFHPTTLAVPFAIVALNAALTNRWRRLVLMSVVIVLLRDDLGLLVAAIALVGARSLDTAGRRRRFVLAVGGLAWVAIGGWIGRELGSDRNFAAHYGYIASTPLDVFLSPIRSLARAAERLFQPDNLGLLAIYAGSVAALVVARVSRLLLAVFVLLPQLLSRDDLFHTSGYHYGAPLFALLILGSAEVASRWQQRRSLPVWIVAAAVAAFVAYGPPSTRALRSGGFHVADAEIVIGHVRENDRVSASANLTPRLAHREVLRQFPYPFASFEHPFPLHPSVTTVGRDAAAGIDAVAVTWRTPQDADDIDRLLASYGFDAVLRLETAALYRRGA